MERKSKALFVFILLAMAVRNLMAQSVVPFVNDEKNTIGNAQYLQSFYKKMDLIDDSNAQVHILNIGD